MTITIKPNKKFTQHHSLFQNHFLVLSHNKSIFRQQHQAMAAMEIGTLGGFK